MTRYIYGSVTRISDLPQQHFTLAALDRSQWATGDYVVGEVLDTSASLHAVELASGRMMEVAEGDLVVGAFGTRAATLEAVGDWQSIESDRFEALTPAGLFGKTTSRSAFLNALMPLRYLGHVHLGGTKRTMVDYALSGSDLGIDCPVVMICGTSMSAGKTMSGRVIIRVLKQSGYKVVAAKLTGAARYRDVLSFGDAGADAIFDFVDVGLPSTVCDADTFRASTTDLLSHIAAIDPDVLVVEAGASPLEAYNGATAIDLLGERIRFTLMCASDPYAVLGVASAFDRQPDLVAGGAANTSAGRELVAKLTKLPAMNLMDRSAGPRLSKLLDDALGLGRLAVGQH